MERNPPAEPVFIAVIKIDFGLGVVPAKITFAGIKIDEPHAFGLASQALDLALPLGEHRTYFVFELFSPDFVFGVGKLTRELLDVVKSRAGDASDYRQKVSRFVDGEIALLIDSNDFAHKKLN